MAVLKKRRRLVTFRVTDDEYNQLRNVCQSEGYRSVSDFAREAVVHRIELHNKPSVSLGEDLATLGMHLEELDGALRDLSGHISKVLGSRKVKE